MTLIVGTGSVPDGSALRRLTAQLSRLSRELVHSGQRIADEGDRWFLGLVNGLERGAHRTHGYIGEAGQRLMGVPLEARRRYLEARRQARIEKLLQIEVNRARLDAPADKRMRFARQMSTLLELVLSGRISIDDVTFEQAAEPSGAAPDSQSASDVSDTPPPGDPAG